VWARRALNSRKRRLPARADRFLGGGIFWGRGNGWALGALVAALEFGEPADAHRATYEVIYRAHCARLASLQGADGAWTPSLLNASGYPLGEATVAMGESAIKCWCSSDRAQ
jgi:rhamnogalacturonyl hydrolase YesR